MADLHTHVKNFAAARSSIQDLERLRCNDAETYILKIRVLLNESLSECLNAVANPQLEQSVLSKRQPLASGGLTMNVFSKRQPSTGQQGAERVI